jgi:hypothetical protein
MQAQVWARGVREEKALGHRARRIERSVEREPAVTLRASDFVTLAA